MVIICLGNKVHCCGNRDDIFIVGSHKNRLEVIIIIGILLSKRMDYCC